jgi:hypothetical protein
MVFLNVDDGMMKRNFSLDECGSVPPKEEDWEFRKYVMLHASR